MRLADVCSIRSGYTPRERLADGGRLGTLTIQQRDLAADGTLELRTAMRTSDRGHTVQHIVSAGEVVFRSRGPFWSASRVPDTNEPIVAIAPLFILHPVTDILDGGYLAWLLQRPNAQRYFERQAKGTGVQMITKSVLAELPISAPAVERQMLICAAAELAAEQDRLERDSARLHRRLTEGRLDAAAGITDTHDRKTR